MTDIKLMKQALEKLEFFAHMKGVSEDTRRLITALRERLAQPNRVWAGLTDEELDAMRQESGLHFVTLREFRIVAKAIEEKLKELNG